LIRNNSSLLLVIRIRLELATHGSVVNSNTQALLKILQGKPELIESGLETDGVDFLSSFRRDYINREIRSIVKRGLAPEKLYPIDK